MKRPWSNSRLSTYQTCPKQFWYSYIENVPVTREPPEAMARGSLVHEKADKYLKGELKMYPPELQPVAAHAMRLKALHVDSEQKLAVKEDWSICDFDDKDAYFRAVLDILYVAGQTVYIQDWKTGQIYDHHTIQLDQYTALAAAHFPEATAFEQRLIYIDQGIVTKPKLVEVGKVKGIRIMLEGEIKIAEDDEIFPVRVGNHCKRCDFSSRYGGPCPH